MKIDNEGLEELGWTILDPQPLDPIDTSLPIRFERKMSLIWPRMSRGLRWIILDMLRRYDREIAKEGAMDAPGWARMRLTRAYHLILSNANGEFQLRLMLPNKGRKTPPHIQLSFVVSSGTFSCWPEGYEPDIPEKTRAVKIKDLVREKIYQTPRQKTLGTAARESQMDAVSERISARIPGAVKEDVLAAVVEHQLNFHLTNATGEAGAIHPVNFGLTALTKKGKNIIVPIGHVTEKIYYQNGWLMMKVADLPASVVTRIVKGANVDEIIQLEAEDGMDGVITPFKGLEITQKMSGNTWMGPHVQIKMGHKP